MYTSKQEKSCIMEFSCDMQVRNICLAKTVGNLIVYGFTSQNKPSLGNVIHLAGERIKAPGNVLPVIIIAHRPL